MYGATWRVPDLKYLIRAMDNAMGGARHPDVQPKGSIVHNEGVFVRMQERQDDTTGRQSLRPLANILIYANKKTMRRFPIPEPYWPESISAKRAEFVLPMRAAIPTIIYAPVDEVYVIPDGSCFPDCFSISQDNAVVQELKTRKPGTCWPLYVENSNSVPGLGLPFGFLKMSVGGSVNLYPMSYDFPRLFRLLHDFKAHAANYRTKPPAGWVDELHRYLRSVPSYYRKPLRKALTILHIENLWPAGLPDAPYAPIIQFATKTLAGASAEWERLQVGRRNLKKGDVKDKAALNAVQKRSEGSCQNPFDVPRQSLLTDLAEMRASLSQLLKGKNHSGKLSQAEEDLRHSVSIAEMGNYAPTMARQRPLRDALEDEDMARKREKNVFGNPYRFAKDASFDEADEASTFGGEDDASSASEASVVTRRRKRPRRSGGSAIKPFDVRRAPRLSSSPAPVLVIPPVVSWNHLHTLNMAQLREDAEKDVLKRGRQRPTSPISHPMVALPAHHADMDMEVDESPNAVMPHENVDGDNSPNAVMPHDMNEYGLANSPYLPTPPPDASSFFDSPTVKTPMLNGSSVNLALLPQLNGTSVDIGLLPQLNGISVGGAPLPQLGHITWPPTPARPGRHPQSGLQSLASSDITASVNGFNYDSVLNHLRSPDPNRYLFDAQTADGAGTEAVTRGLMNQFLQQ
ncbi:Integrator complex subunit 6 [Borealophlyctis nickersoniae]|nr:Integrator complex subunit 6 [Borealophlyctis nickersoniae]